MMGQNTFQDRLLIATLGWAYTIICYPFKWNTERVVTNNTPAEFRSAGEESNAFPDYLCDISYVVTGKWTLEKRGRREEKQRHTNSRQKRSHNPQEASKLLRTQRKISSRKADLRQVDPSGLHYLQHTLKLPIPAPLTECCNSYKPARAPVFIAIDSEYTDSKLSTRGFELREVGLSVLDTQYLFEAAMDPQTIIKTYHFRTKNRGKTFLFGTTVVSSQDSLVANLKTMLYMDDTPHHPQRNIILVGHSVMVEIQNFKSVGIDLRLAPAVVAILDTQEIGAEVFGSKYGLNLRRVVQLMGMSGRGFHNAGNDANYTLRAMLLLAIHGYDIGEKEDVDALESIELYMQIAKF